jgi:hypothetical protein
MTNIVIYYMMTVFVWSQTCSLLRSNCRRLNAERSNCYNYPDVLGTSYDVLYPTAEMLILRFVCVAYSNTDSDITSKFGVITVFIINTQKLFVHTL